MTQKERPQRIWYARVPQLFYALILTLVSTASIPAMAQQIRVELDPAQTKVNIFVHDVHGGVHGTFQMRSGTVGFEPATGAASGEVIIDPNTGSTGNDSRDHKMKKDVLETQRYPEITFSATHIIGQVASAGKSSLKVVGVFHIHGADHPLTLDVAVDVNGDHVTGTTTFTVPYESWGMKNPSFLFLRVDGTAQVNVAFAGRLVVPTSARSQAQSGTRSH